MKYLGSDLLLQKLYAIELTVYLVGWIVVSFGLIKTVRDRPGFLRLGYSHQNLKVFGLSLLWPLFIAMIPLVIIGFLVWMFLQPSKG